MLTSLRRLRSIIREEIGRNLQTSDDLERYPWIVDDINVEIYPDAGSEKWWVSVEIEPGKFVKSSKQSQEEANWWAREQWSKARRKKFSQDPKDD